MHHCTMGNPSLTSGIDLTIIKAFVEVGFLRLIETMALELMNCLGPVTTVSLQ